MMPVRTGLNKNNICVENKPANIIRFYQLFDVTVNGHRKKFMESKFNSWYNSETTKQFNEGEKLDEVNVRLVLSALIPLHALCLAELYIYMTSVKGKYIIASGWRAAGITNAINHGTKKLPPFNQFHDNDS